MDPRNPGQVAELFSTSLSSDPNVRMNGEIQIRAIGTQEGLLTSLMHVISEESVPIATRQACAVYLKNRVKKAYGLKETSTKLSETALIAPSDRQAIRTHILSLLVASPSRPIRVQLANTFKDIISHDFPDQWPTLIDEIVALLQSGNPHSIFGACVALQQVVKSARFRVDESVIPKIVEQTFPILVRLGAEIANSFTPDNAETLHFILKIYRTSTQSTLTQHQQSAASIVPWGRLFFQVINAQLPAGTSLPGSPDDWQKSEWWKAKKWAYSTLNRLFERYGNPSQLPSSIKKQVKQFSEHFVTTFAPEIFKTYLHQVELYVAKQSWLSNKCQSNINQFFTACVKPKSTWSILKPHVSDIVTKFIFPMVQFDQQRAELWQTDPVEYIRHSSVEDFDDFNDPSVSGTGFVLQLVQSRSKTTFPIILALINSVLTSPTSTPEEKFGALSFTVTLGGVIMRNPAVKPLMEDFEVNHVFPAMTAPQGFMRQVACEVVGTLERFGLEWTKPANLETAFRGIGSLMEDPELPVRVPAVLAMAHMIRHDSVRQALAPNMEKVMQTLFVLSDETDLEVISEAMETFIESFQSELVPVSGQITQRLTQTYVRLLSESVSAAAAAGPADDSSIALSVDDDKTMAMMGIAKTIETIVDALVVLDEPTPLLTQVQELVIPIITLTFQQNVLEMFDSMLALVDNFTFNLRTITPSMWAIFEQMYALFKGPAIDYLDEMIPSLDNFIEFGKDVFAQNAEYRRMVLDIFTVGMTSPQLGQGDQLVACSLGESILLNMRGLIDDALPHIIAATASQFRNSDERTTSRPLRIGLLNLLINAVLYNPALALQIMASPESSGLARQFFDAWFVALGSSASIANGGRDELPRVHDKRLSILTLSKLMEMGPNDVPESLRSGWAGIVAGALNAFKELPTAMQKRQALKEQLERDTDEFEYDDDEDFEGMLEGGDDDEDVHDEDDEYLEMITAEAERMRAQRKATAASGGSELATDDVSEESDEDDEMLVEELDVETSIDSVDPYVAFKQSLTAFQMVNPAGYQAATTSLNMEQQTYLMEIMNLAQQRETEA